MVKDMTGLIWKILYKLIENYIGGSNSYQERMDFEDDFAIQFEYQHHVANWFESLNCLVVDYKVMILLVMLLVVELP